MKKAALYALGALLIGGLGLALMSITPGPRGANKIVGELAAPPGGHEESAEGASEAEMSMASARHIDKLIEAVPGLEEGPTSASEAAFQQRAYPADTISVAQMNGAASAFGSAKGRPFPAGKGRPGSWVSVGPNEALYPGTPLLTSADYVPNRYVAGGRTTSIAISDTCKPGNCKVYVTPAGGGVWRTKNALDGQPNWEYLGDRSASTPPAPSPSTRTIRPTTPSTSARARRTSAVPAALPEPVSTNRPTAATLGRSSATAPSTASESGRSW